MIIMILFRREQRKLSEILSAIYCSDEMFLFHHMDARVCVMRNFDIDAAADSSAMINSCWTYQLKWLDFWIRYLMLTGLLE